MRAGLCVNDLRCDAEAVVGTPNTALEHVTRAQLAPDLGYVDGFTLVLKGGVAREDTQVARSSCQRGHHVLGQTVAEILLVRVAAQVDERKNRGRRTVGHASTEEVDAKHKRLRDA